MLKKYQYIPVVLAFLALGLAGCGTNSTAVVPTAPVVAVTASAQPTMASIAPVSRFGTIPQGQTPEGYHVLGAPNASVTLIMYSDFL